jgi:hypothetical protein
MFDENSRTAVLTRRTCTVVFYQEIITMSSTRRIKKIKIKKMFNKLYDLYVVLTAHTYLQ